MRTIILLFVDGGPIALALTGAGVAGRRTAQLLPRLGADQASASWSLVVNSAFAYALSFNIAFFI